MIFFPMYYWEATALDFRWYLLASPYYGACGEVQSILIGPRANNFDNSNKFSNLSIRLSAQQFVKFSYD